MLMRSLVALAAVSTVSARKQKKVISANTGDIAADSKLGNRILSQARALDGNNDFSWVSAYSIKFHSCVTTTDYYGGYFGGNDNNNNNNNNNNGYNGVYEQKLVHFQLCPTDSCSSSCDGGANYVLDLSAFVEAYLEFQMTVQEYNCEMVEANCYSDDAYSCYAAAGLDYCGDNDEEGAFDLQEAAQCAQLEVDEDAMQYYYWQNGGNNNNNNNYNNNNGNNNNNGEMEYFVGPVCANNGKAINLGVFMDETCSYPAESGIYEKLNYGQALPYASSNIIEDNCISCKEPVDYDDNNNGDNDDEDEVVEICERVYEDAGKCETGMNIYYPNTYACDFIQTLKVGKGISFSAPSVTAKALAGVFAVTTAAFGGLAYYLHTKVQRKNVNLSDQGNGQLA